MNETVTIMRAFHGDPAIKEKYVARVRMHREADHLVRGTGWENGKGCAVGCTLEKYDHNSYETELGIPRSLASLEDGLFESLPVEIAMQWPERFLAAIEPGSDLSLVVPKFLYWLLVDPKDGVVTFTKSAKVLQSIQDVAGLIERKIAGQDGRAEEWLVRQNAAYAAYADADADTAAAAYAAYAAAAYAAYAATAAAYAADAAYAAAYAAYAAYAARYAADAATAAAYAADAAYAAAYAAYAAAIAAARYGSRIKQADKLILLLGGHQ